MNAARAGVQGFTTHGFSVAVTALIVLALVAAAAFLTDGPWWQKLLAGLGTYAVYAALLLGSSWLVIAIFVAGVKRKERKKQRFLRKVLALVHSGDPQAAAYLASLAKPESWVEHYDEAFRQAPELAKEYAAAAREAGELRALLLQVLLQHAPWHPEVAAVLVDSLETFDSGQLRRWLRWMGSHAPREPQREERVAAGAERAFARLDEAQRRYAWREILPDIQDPAAWQRLAGIYAEDLRALNALANLSSQEREGMRKLRLTPSPEPSGGVC